MTTRFRARFDGKTIIPLDPVDLPVDAILDIEICSHGERRKGSPALLRKLMREQPRASREDTAEMEKVIEAGKLPANYDGIFDEPASH